MGHLHRWDGRRQGHKQLQQGANVQFILFDGQCDRSNVRQRELMQDVDGH
eukprot:gene21620-16085_t